eukprot:CAMPEP_0182918908 /NCGR_PEP_ID=MMETSP0105_2-20130417/2364_1 /TAXON_ID=81532 ORGANISM="Acanthoeca-like sp., Strain 10tr" /NCGR_SAMPLE_ID=MMETSP0105_2 /ASSEMBLY_ACC=CAM_ASM_000205 /LENGTH=220 /DNA_ID=CAMNT_0025056031 /DNA_START=138 /DNA_END=801 /DNA_ORIENTATION=-
MGVHDLSIMAAEQSVVAASNNWKAAFSWHEFEDLHGPVVSHRPVLNVDGSPKRVVEEAMVLNKAASRIEGDNNGLQIGILLPLSRRGEPLRAHQREWPRVVATATQAVLWDLNEVVHPVTRPDDRTLPSTTTTVRRPVVLPPTVLAAIGVGEYNVVWESVAGRLPRHKVLGGGDTAHPAVTRGGAVESDPEVAVQVFEDNLRRAFVMGADRTMLSSAAAN